MALCTATTVPVTAMISLIHSRPIFDDIDCCRGTIATISISKGTSSKEKCSLLAETKKTDKEPTKVCFYRAVEALD